MEVGYVKVKQYVINKAEETSRRYNTWIDIYSRDDKGSVVIEDGYVTVMVQEVISESEKAVQVILSTGDIVGSTKGWKTWIPKSAIM